MFTHRLKRHARAARLTAAWLAAATVAASACAQDPPRAASAPALGASAAARLLAQIPEACYGSPLERTAPRKPNADAYHWASMHREVTRRCMLTPGDARRFFEVQGLAERFGAQDEFAGRVVQSRGIDPIPFSKFPNTWLVVKSFGICVATSVGPRSILTAHHCIKDKPEIKLRYALNGVQQEASAVCTALQGSDIAVCEVVGTGAYLIMPPAGYESVSVTANGPPQAGAAISIVTFQTCDGVKPPLDKLNEIDAHARPWPQQGGDAEAEVVAADRDRLCPFDSGSPWMGVGAAPMNLRLLAIHRGASGNIAKGSPLGTTAVEDFLRRQKQPICGVALKAGAKPCR